MERGTVVGHGERDCSGAWREGLQWGIERGTVVGHGERNCSGAWREGL